MDQMIGRTPRQTLPATVRAWMDCYSPCCSPLRRNAAVRVSANTSVIPRSEDTFCSSTVRQIVVKMLCYIARMIEPMNEVDICPPYCVVFNSFDPAAARSNISPVKNVLGYARTTAARESAETRLSLQHVGTIETLLCHLHDPHRLVPTRLIMATPVSQVRRCDVHATPT